MNPPLRFALHGFSDFEHRALGSFFRLAARPALALEQVRELVAADVIVADAEQPGAVEQLLALRRVADTVFIGEQAPEGAAARLSRPIDALQVLREIEALASRRAAAGAATPAPVAASPRRAWLPRNAPGFVPRVPTTTQPGAPRRAAQPSALLVDDSPIALRYLQLRLQDLGVDTDLSHGSGRALELLAQRAYGFVFIDVELGEGSALDGLALCQHIKRQHRHVEGHSPVLVLVSAHHGEIDRARGTFAGCDHYLAKPADDKALRQLLSQHRPRPAPRAARR